MAVKRPKTAPDVITEQVSVPPAPRVSGRLMPSYSGPVKSTTVSVDADSEYVSGGARLWSVNYLRTLSFAIDDVTQDFGDDLYDRMLLDPQVASDIETLTLAILGDGVQLLPAVKQYDVDEATGERTENPDYELAAEISAFIERNLADLAGSFSAETATPLYWSLYDMLRAAALGNRVAEKVFTIPDSGEDAGRICLKALKVKPRKSLAFLVDVFNNTLGFLALIPGYGAPVLTQGMVIDPAHTPNLLPPRKFAVLTWRGRDGDPRGCSLLRPAYEPWFTKVQLKVERLRWFSQMAGGAIIGTTPEQSNSAQALDAAGNIITDAYGNPVMVTPEQSMLTALLAWQNGTVGVLPFGSTIQAIFPHPESPFDEGLDRQDREISMAILGQTRMTHEAQHGSKADSNTGQDVFGLRVMQGKRALASMLQLDIVSHLVELNYGRDALRLCPLVSLNKTEQQDFAANATAAAALQQSGYFAPSQYREVDAMLGLPVRTEEMQEPQEEPQQPGAGENEDKTDAPDDTANHSLTDEEVARESITESFMRRMAAAARRRAGRVE